MIRSYNKKNMARPDARHRFSDSFAERVRGCICDLRGFTLVELVVVLVIIAILAATVGPALIGYIDKVKENSTLNNAKKAYLAAQTLSEEAHSALVNPDLIVTDSKVLEMAQIKDNAESATIEIVYIDNTWNISNPTNGMYVINEFTYNQGGFSARYSRNNATWTVTKAAN